MKDTSSLTAHLALQIRVSKMLSWGFIFTIWPAAAITSCVAVFIGIRAMILINQSLEPLAGKLIAWWCILAGSLQNLWSVWTLFHKTG